MADLQTFEVKKFIQRIVRFDQAPSSTSFMLSAAHWWVAGVGSNGTFLIVDSFCPKFLAIESVHAASGLRSHGPAGGDYCVIFYYLLFFTIYYYAILTISIWDSYLIHFLYSKIGQDWQRRKLQRHRKSWPSWEIQRRPMEFVRHCFGQSGISIHIWYCSASGLSA